MLSSCHVLSLKYTSKVNTDDTNCLFLSLEPEMTDIQYIGGDCVKWTDRKLGAEKCTARRRYVCHQTGKNTKDTRIGRRNIGTHNNTYVLYPLF